MGEMKKVSVVIRVVCALFAIIGAAAIILEIARAEEFSFHFKYVAIPFSLFIFGFVAIKGENPMDYLDKIGGKGKDQ